MKALLPTFGDTVKRYIVTFALLLGGSAQADMVVLAGATVNASASAVDFACTDLIIGGTFNLGTGSLVNVRDVVIQPGGSLSATSGSIAVTRNWSNSGSFVAGTGTVAFADSPSCATSSAISGSTTFYNLSLTSAAGRTVTLAPGLTQTVLAVLTVTGTTALPIQVSSGSAALAFINLTGPGQIISNVSVNNVAATGQWLAAGQTNRTVGGLAPNWFGDGFVVPTLSGAALLILTFLIAFCTFLSGTRLRRIYR
ncbi:MAG: hypothetical protein H7203_14975 [Rhizobacter sp.]|nr:hypothetical protein [Burkholderiales bacterium]